MRSYLPLGIVFATIGSCVTPKPQPPVPPPLLRLDVGVYDVKGAITGATVAVIDGVNEGVHGTTGLQGNIILTGLKSGGFTVCATDARYDKGCVGVVLTADSATQIHLTQIVTTPPTPPAGAAPVLRADGRIFRDAAGRPWRYKGVSAFALFDRITRGEDVRDLLNAYKGYNVVRVWPYVPKKDWGQNAWDVTYTAAEAKEYLKALASLGWTVELTLLTDDDPARLAWAKTFVQDLARAPRPTNLLIEIGNEPETHKKINTAALRNVLDASGFVYASGNYEDSSKAFGKYFVIHTARDGEWPRRSHDCLEMFNGGGPNKPTDPAHPGPCVLDEPAKAQDVTPAADDWRAYFGSGSLMAAGGTFHSETGKYAKPPTAQEMELAAAALEGLNAFPADAPLLGYGRPVEHSLRTYTAGGRYMARVRPTTATPGAGWSRIGSSNIFWSH